MIKRFLFVTANTNETAALLEIDSSFDYRPNQRSNNPDDNSFYNIGYLGEHEVIHFELEDQGSVRSEASLSSIYLAIDYWTPDAVILVGIAFGRDNDNMDGARQHIGDVLISTKIADYESGKIKDGKLQSDASIPECGITLRSAFRNFSKEWKHSINSREVECNFGLVLSGDKVVDDASFKKELFAKYPRAIGGEMEGRGAYAACRKKRLEEWIIIKAICDWGENKGNPHKERDQQIAARSAVSLLKHVFSIKDAFEKLPRKEKTVKILFKKEEALNSSCPLGYFINIGTTTCRLFEVIDKSTMHELCLVSYDISNPADEGYLEGIISHVKKAILPRIKARPSKLFPKVFVDYNFSEVFSGSERHLIQKDFVREFYEQTSLYFNILTKSQTIDNLRRLFENIPAKTAIITINSHSVDVLEFTGKEFHMYTIEITLSDIKKFVVQRNFPEIWTKDIIISIKKFILKQIGTLLEKVIVENAIIIKDELKFMKDNAYPLKKVDNQLSLSQSDYKKSNKNFLFSVDYRSVLENKYKEESVVNRMYGFKYGHIIIETILDLIENQRVIPKNNHSIHGSGTDAYIAYIFNVVISGSTHEGREKYLFEAHERLQEMKATVLSPRINSDRTLEPITDDTEYAHLRAIEECDMLFICNKGDDGYIGESTKCEIYYAYALRKTIAFWQDPPADKQISFIPKEHWKTIMSLNT